jgi:putative tricarboxylic transport membrane protein
MSEPMSGPAAPPTRGADLGAALFVLAVGLLALWQTTVIPTSPIYAQVGPKLVPYLVSACLVALGAGLVAVALRGGWSQDNEELVGAAPLNPRALGLLMAGLLVNMVLIEPFGFTIAATAQFVLVAAAFGSRAYLRNLLIAFCVALAAYGLFVKGLGVNIGAGVVEALVFGDPG